MNGRLISLAALVAAAGLLIAAPSNATQKQCSEVNFDNCVDGVTAAFASTHSLRITTDNDVNRQGGDAEGDEALTLRGTLLGQAAGDGFSGWSVWGGFDRSDFENVGAQDFESDLNNFTLGVDTFRDRHGARGSHSRLRESRSHRHGQRRRSGRRRFSRCSVRCRVDQ